MAFGKAFAAARKAGKKVFTYNGKKYNTKLAADTPKKGPIPSPNPKKSGRSEGVKKATSVAPKSGKPTKAPPKAVPTPTPKPANPSKSGAQPSRAAANAQERRYKNDDIRSFRKKKK